MNDTGTLPDGSKAAVRRLKLTSKRTVEAASGPTTEAELKRGYAIHWDTEIQNLGLRVTKAGVRSFILQAYVKGRSARKTIGRYPGVSPSVARKRAADMMGEIARGGDPLARIEREKLAAVTVENAFKDYFKVKDLKEGTVADMEKALKETFESWKKKPITKITRRMVERRYLERAAKSKARANVAFRYLRAVLNLAATRYRDSEDRPILEDNPVRILSEGKLWRKVPRRRTVLTPDDLKTWVPSIFALGEPPQREPGTGRQFPKLRNGEVHRDMFLFLALTGCRKGEALKLRKEDVDLKRELLIFRDTKNRTDHELPLAPYTKELLQRRIKASPTKWVFSSPHDGCVVTNTRYATKRVSEDTGLNFTPHDLRRLFATTLERLGVPAYTVKALLNHATESRDVTGGYVVVDNAMKKAAMEKIELFLLQHINNSSKIVDINSKRKSVNCKQ